MTIKLSLNLKGEFSLDRDNRGNAAIEFTTEKDEVLSHFDASEVAAYFEADDLLDEIGKQAAMDKWGLVDEE